MRLAKMEPPEKQLCDALTFLDGTNKQQLPKNKDTIHPKLHWLPYVL